MLDLDRVHAVWGVGDYYYVHHHTRYMFSMLSELEKHSSS